MVTKHLGLENADRRDRRQRPVPEIPNADLHIGDTRLAPHLCSASTEAAASIQAALSSSRVGACPVQLDVAVAIAGAAVVVGIAVAAVVLGDLAVVVAVMVLGRVMPMGRPRGRAGRLGTRWNREAKQR
jgi:hypothetical protein